MSYTFFAMLGLFAVNVMTPGASFVLTVSNAMKHGRRSGLLIALGLATADTMFAAMATAGLAALVSQNVLLVKAVSLLGGMWFACAGIRLILKQKAAQLPVEAEKTAGNLLMGPAYRLGFSAGAFNAQAILFFSTMFIGAISSRPDLREAIALVAGVAAVSAFTRSGIVTLFTTGTVMRFYATQRRKVETVSGGMLALFGLKIATPAALVLTQSMLAIFAHSPKTENLLQTHAKLDFRKCESAQYGIAEDLDHARCSHALRR
ncbi:LysE family translocator [Paraburkholderia silviterrae]|uniref:LysE family translocator n=1 Tax=Paraburkholderia silviterrae TaxID=2528715 RepID=A0A4R5M1K2_9BURK|nr:LysE family translocator [Paraburkholderia silviterrae]TDG19147.1 LysE family translocator [Paraburkholderia silviterrae]